MLNHKIVILCNISLHNIVTYREQILSRMRRFFQEMSLEGNILLWRPHPQLKTQLQKIDKDLYKKYILLENDFKENKFGVFDEREQIDWAMMVSDIYYGDPGTVYEEFIRSHKPAIMINMSGVFFPIGINLYKENSIYGIDHDYGTIVKYDILKQKWSHCKVIPNHAMQVKLFHQSIKYKDKMIFSPYLSNKLMIYDVTLDKVTLLEMPLKKQFMSKKKANFLQMLLKGNDLYLMPAGYRAILRFDLLSFKFTEFLVLEDYIGDNAHMSFSYCTVVDDKHFAVASFVSNIVLLVEYETGNYIVKKLGREDYRFANIINYKNELWLTAARHAVVVRWDYKNDVEEIIEDFPKEFEMYNGNIFNDTAALIYDNNLYCVPAKSNMGIVVDIVHKKIMENIVLKPYIENIDKKISVFDTHCHSDHIFYLQHQSYAFLIYDVKNERVIESRCEMDAEECIKKEIDIIKDVVKQLEAKQYEQRNNEYRNK